MASLTINTSIAIDPQLQLQQLREQQAAINAVHQAQNQSIQAQIDSLSAMTSHQHHRSPIHKQQHHRRREVPRSMSTQGTTTTMSRHLSSERTDAAAISRSLSQRSATSMSRSNSRGSTTHRSGNIPFASTLNTPVRPLTLLSDNSPESTILADWNTREEPFSSYAPSHQAQSLQRSISQHKSGLQRVPEHGRILDDLPDPSEYLSRQLGTPILAISPPMPLSSSPMPVSHRGSMGSFDFPTPSTPSTAPLTHATTLDNHTMSRSTSLFNDNFEMMRINSTASYSDVNVDHAHDQVTPTFSSSCHSRSSNEEQAQLLAGAGGASHVSQFSHSLPTSFTTSASFGAQMEKSDSNESNSSSLSSRNRMRLKLQNQHAASREIKPKGGDENVMSRSNSSHPVYRTDSRDGLQDKVAISKPSYQRPKHERVACKQCDNHPEGFRGEHELRRHQDREHKKFVKKWIAIEPTGEGREKPIVPLAKCKACGQLKKTYGAYYNVAAHLRRTHFKPRSSKSRNKGKKEPEEKRGGKGGGDWPPMSELKHWMKEVEVAGVDNEILGGQQNEDDVSDDEHDTVIEQPQHFANANDYQDVYYNIATPFAYQSNVDDICDTSITLDLQAQCIDQTMYCGSSQDFSSFPQVFQSDHSALYDGSQYYEDPGSLTGSDFVNFSFS